MAKDAKGHGSDTGTKGMRLIKTHTNGPHSAKVYNNPEWGEKVVKTFFNGQYQPKNDYHTDDVADAHGTAQSQLKRWADQDAASALSSGTSKSAAAPITHGMAKQISAAEGSMSRLRETFHAGNNKHGEYGRNTKDAFDRHAKLHSELTGGKQRHIYD